MSWWKVVPILCAALCGAPAFFLTWLFGATAASQLGIPVLAFAAMSFMSFGYGGYRATLASIADSHPDDFPVPEGEE